MSKFLADMTTMVTHTSLVKRLLSGLAALALGFMSIVALAPAVHVHAAPILPQQFAEINCAAGDAHPIDAHTGDNDENVCCPTKNTNPPTGMSCFFDKYGNPAINFLSAAVGIVIVIGIIMGAIQYSSAGGDPGKVQKARERIRDALVALAAFIFLFSFLQWFIPGGFSF